MKKAIIFNFCMLHLAFYCFSQQAEPKFSVQVSGGASFPLGKFGDKSIYQDTTSTAPGWAKPGPAIQVALNYHVNTSFGLSLEFGGQQNKQNETSVESNYILHAPSSADSNTYKTNVQDWKISKILVGFFLSMPISKNGNLYFQPKFLAGAMKANMPGYTVVVYQMVNGVRGGGEPVFYSSAPLPWAFCYQAEAVLAYKLNSAFYLSASLNYSHASPNRDYNATYVSNSTQGYKHYDTRYPISSLNILLGVGVRF